MPHKNLLNNDKYVREQIEVALHRKASKCWKLNKVRFDRQGAEDSRDYEKKLGNKYYIYKCPFCKTWHLTKRKQNGFGNKKI